MILAAHRRYLDRTTNPAIQAISVALETQWITTGRSVALARIAELTPRQRAALNLHLVEGVHLDEVSALLSLTHAETASLINSATSMMLVDVSEVAAIFAHAELWLGDEERESVRAALETRHGRPGDSDDRHGPRGTRVTAGKAVTAVAIGAMLAVGVRWAQSPGTSNSDQSSADASPGSTVPVVDATSQSDNPPAVVTEGAFVQDSDDSSPPIVITDVGDGLSAAELIVMGSGLTDPMVVVPDQIVVYSDGRLGMSWTGPCNRPALAAAVTNTVAGAIIELTTGAFPVVSCLGMPDRWTAVIDTTTPRSQGVVRAVDSDGKVVITGYTFVNTESEQIRQYRPGAGYRSALVDDAGQPWVYGSGCSTVQQAIDAPGGVLYSVRTDTVDPQQLSTGDASVCQALAQRPALSGPNLAVFPQPPYDSDRAIVATPTACDGPAGSPTEMSGQMGADPVTTFPVPTADLSDGDWSTWDGCLVRSDVISSQSEFPRCVGAEVRTVTFAVPIGERMTTDRETVTFVRDPSGVVNGRRPPFLSYSVPPSDLVDTGLRFGDQQLLVSPRAQQAIYVRVGGPNVIVERWPPLIDEMICS